MDRRPAPPPRSARPAQPPRPPRQTPAWGATLGAVLRLRAQRFGRMLMRWALPLSRLPRRAGVTASALLVAAAGGYGAVHGEHIPAVIAGLKDARDGAANAAGFRIATVAVTGRKQLADEEILAAAGVGATTSLLFLDVEAARAALESTPWIAQATVRKLYPDHLQIVIEEREAFALWQRDGQISVIAADGTVLGPYGERRTRPLPLVVGPGAGARAQALIGLLAHYPAIHNELRAAVLVADRRWNLKLKSGLDIRLPEQEVGQALDTLMALERDKKILSRDLTSIDLRLPDRVSVRLSDEAAQAREAAEKERKKKAAKAGAA